MLIECPNCKARVDAKNHGHRAHYNPKDDPFPYCVAVLECPTCGHTLVGFQEEVEDAQGGTEWTDADRLWPEPKRPISGSIPDIVRLSLEEADRCFNAAAYSACVVMCGRALEGVCVHFKMPEHFAAGLQALRDAKFIDDRLFTWGDELRKMRNLGAHASTEKVPRDDARDALNFLHAICDYVFVLNRRFEAFMERRKKSGQPANESKPASSEPKNPV